MTLRYLIDTVIIIDHLNGIMPATRWLAKTQTGEAAISVVTLAEVMAGAKPSEKAEIKLFLESFECIPITYEVSIKAAELRQRCHWKLPDAFQAAAALENNLKLVTRNTKDFPIKKHHFVLMPYKT